MPDREDDQTGTLGGFPGPPAKDSARQAELRPRARRPRVLVADDNFEMAQAICESLGDRGYDAVAAGSGRDAEQRLAGERFDALVTDLRMPGTDGLELLSVSRRLDPDRPVIVMTAYSAIDTAVESIRRGAYHYLTKPFKQDELVIFLQRALEEVRLRREASALKSALRAKFSVARILGSSAGMQAVRDRVQRVADAPAPVIVLGETGTGKGLVARALHGDSRRAERPFVSLNCAALPEALMESELFGHVKGAFTGAVADRGGLFAEADGGTLFLDEISEMAPGLQAKLLHVLESGTVRAVGATREQTVDVRVVAATHRNLADAVRAGRFREDLLYRLDVVSVVIPPLRDRGEDIPELIEHFLGEVRARYPQSPVRGFAPAALAELRRYRWPGNVRELAHVVEQAVLLGRDPEIAVEDLSPAVHGGGAAPSEPFEFRGEITSLRELDRRYAAWAVGQTGGHRGQAAEKLGVDPKTLRKLLGELDRSDG